MQQEERGHSSPTRSPHTRMWSHSWLGIVPVSWRRVRSSSSRRTRTSSRRSRWHSQAQACSHPSPPRRAAAEAVTAEAATAEEATAEEATAVAMVAMVAMVAEEATAEEATAVAMVAEGSGLSNEDHRPRVSAALYHAPHHLSLTAEPFLSDCGCGERSQGTQWACTAPEYPTHNTVQRYARWEGGAHSSRSSPQT
jgi:ribosomal protein L18